MRIAMGPTLLLQAAARADDEHEPTGADEAEAPLARRDGG